MPGRISARLRTAFGTPSGVSGALRPPFRPDLARFWLDFRVIFARFRVCSGVPTKKGRPSPNTGPAQPNRGSGVPGTTRKSFENRYANASVVGARFSDHSFSIWPRLGVELGSPWGFWLPLGSLLDPFSAICGPKVHPKTHPMSPRLPQVLPQCSK